MTVKLTEAAAVEIKRVLDEQNREELKYVRVGVVGGGCSGFQYAFNFTDDFDSTRRLVSTVNRLQSAPSQPPDAGGPTDPVLGTHGSLSSPLLWRPPACLLETVEHSQRRRRKHHRL